jgi:hypothetical protein
MTGRSVSAVVPSEMLSCRWTMGFAVADQDGFPRPEITPVFMPTPGATNCGADCSSTWMRLVSRRARPGSLGKKAAAFLNRFGDVPCILLVGAQALAQVALNLS